MNGRFGRLEVHQGDITRLSVDAIVNAANPALAPGSGVCGAIHAAAGPGLAQECGALGRCPTGDVRLTGGHRLPARFVVHAVGPVWGGGGNGEDEALASCYRRAIEVAVAAGARSIAFPAISTGIYGFPLERATRIAIVEARAGLRRHPGLERLVLCCFSAGDLAVYLRIASGVDLDPPPPDGP
jgi:O-acetyl-ADP-ribose deacetylase (regulator of RNase III)